MSKANLIYPYFDFGFSTRENVFLTIVLRKFRMFKTWYQYPYAYMSQLEKKILLGDPTFKKRLRCLIDAKAVREIIIGRNPNNMNQNLCGYIPQELPYQREKAYLPYLANYYNRINKSLSKESSYIYDTMLNTTINLNDEELLEALLDSSKRHNIVEAEEYVSKYFQLLRDMILDFNSNSHVAIVEDPFGNRIHTLISQIIKEIRQSYIYINDKPTSELDLHQSQMVILGKVANTLYGENSFSKSVINSDIYKLFGEMNGIMERGEQKKLMFRALFDRQGSKADLMFKNAFPDLYPFILDFKTTLLCENPSKKRYSNLAFMLQREETAIFREVWRNLINHKVAFLTAHDSIIVERENTDKALQIMRKTLVATLGSYIHINRFN